MSDLGTSDPVIRTRYTFAGKFYSCPLDVPKTIRRNSLDEEIYPSFGWRIRTVKAKYAKGFKPK